MIQKMFDSTRSSHVASIHDNDFVELVWGNGEVVVRGGSSSNRKRKSNEERIHEDGSITKRIKLNTLYSFEDHFPPNRDSDNMSSSHQNNGQDLCQCQSSRSKNNSGNLHEKFANLLTPVKDSKGNTHLQQQCLPSSQISSPGVTKTRNPSLDQRTTKVNFSNFSIPAMFLKSTTSQGSSATHLAKNDASQARVEEKPAKESNGFQKQTYLTVERSTKPPQPLDEHSEAIVGHNISIHKRSQGQQFCDQNLGSEALRAKGKANTDTCHEPWLASSSMCSLGASNDPNFGIRKHEDTDDSTYLSDNDGEPGDIEKQMTDREGNRVKRSRNAVVHNLSEKKRRENINKKMRTLKDLIPNCNKVDKASMLDDAIDYLKTLKLQLQIMSMGGGLWPTLMMHHMNGAHLPQLVGAGMGFRPTPQLPIPRLSPITDNRLNMFGFPNMPMAHAPFFPIIGNSATQPHLPTTTTTTNMVQHFNSLPNNLDPHQNAATKQVSGQSCFLSTPHHTSTPPLATTTFVFPKD